MCESFFEKNNLEKIDGFDEVLEAIQKHDDKEYRFMVYHAETSQKNVLSVLCVSDDLDAFGAIGVFRYAEIYLLRNTLIKELARKVLEDLERRYKNFCNLYSNLDAFTKKQKARYEFTRKFYQDLEKELNNMEYSRTIRFGAIGVLNVLITNIVEGEISMLDISDRVLKESNDHYVIEFFKQFKKEVEKVYSQGMR